MTEQEVIRATIDHIKTVGLILQEMAALLVKRSYSHDNSKLKDPELPTFIEFTPKLKDSTYGSEEYKQFLAEMKPALDHHYANNRHHPEHFPNGVNDMNLIDLIEMVCDWKAAGMRHANGDFVKSVEHNTERFGLSPQLKQIILNTATLL